MGAVTPTAGLVARDAAERAAMADMARAVPGRLGRRFGVAVREEGDLLALRVDAVPARELNRAMGLGPSASDAARQARALARFFAGRPHIAALGPDADEDAADALAAAGYAPAHPWDVFLHEGPAPAPAPGAPPVEILEPGPDAEDAGSAVCVAFGLPAAAAAWVAALAGRPGWRLLATRGPGGAVSGAGALRTGTEGAWLGLGGTRPDDRGRGAQGARFAVAIATAREAGCALVTTETGAPGPDGPGPSYRNILRAGFRPMGRRENWIR